MRSTAQAGAFQLLDAVVLDQAKRVDVRRRILAERDQGEATDAVVEVACLAIKEAVDAIVEVPTERIAVSEPRLRRCAERGEFERTVDDLAVQGYKIKSRSDTTAMLEKPDWGTAGGHAIVGSSPFGGRWAWAISPTHS